MVIRIEILIYENTSPKKQTNKNPTKKQPQKTRTPSPQQQQSKI